MDEYVGDIRQRVLERMDLSREMSDEEIENLIGEEASRLMQEEPISIRERLMLEARVFNSLRKLDALQELLDDPEISEIMVNGPKHIFYEKAGRVHAWNQAFASEEKMQDVIQQIVGRHNRVVNLSNPIVDTRLADGSRVNIVLAPVSLDGSTITIRKFPEKPLDMQTLIQKGALPDTYPQTPPLFPHLYPHFHFHQTDKFVEFHILSCFPQPNHPTEQLHPGFSSSPEVPPSGKTCAAQADPDNDSSGSW